MFRPTASKATKLYNALDARGRAAVQYQMLTDQVQKAIDAVGSTPGKFSRGMNRLEHTRVAFTGQDRLAWMGCDLILQAPMSGRSHRLSVTSFTGGGRHDDSRSEKVLRA